MRAETMISEDRGLMARAFGTVMVLGAAFIVVLLVADPDVFRAAWAAIVAASVGLALGPLCFVLYRRIPRWGFHALLLSSAGFLLVLTMAASTDAVPLFLFFYAWVALFAGLFFAARAALAHIAFALATLAVILIVRDPPFAPAYVLAVWLVVVTSSVSVWLLRRRTEQVAADLASQAQTDPLTALANRRGFDLRFTLESDRAQREGNPLALIICDLDHFKAVNDELGHEEGDRALRKAAAVIAGSVRSVDAVSRLGGEEFGVLLPGATVSEAFEVAERVREGILEAFEDDPVAITASCGLAAVTEPDGDPRRLFAYADAALYQAKRAGRNCTVVYTPPPAGGAPADDAISTK